MRPAIVIAIGIHGNGQMQVGLQSTLPSPRGGKELK